MVNIFEHTQTKVVGSGQRYVFGQNLAGPSPTNEMFSRRNRQIRFVKHDV